MTSIERSIQVWIEQSCARAPLFSESNSLNEGFYPSIGRHLGPLCSSAPCAIGPESPLNRFCLVPPVPIRPRRTEAKNILKGALSDVGELVRPPTLPLTPSFTAQRAAWPVTSAIPLPQGCNPARINP